MAMQVQSERQDAHRTTSADEEDRWYAAYTRSNHEKRVAEQLDLRNIEQLLPLYSSIRQWKDRRVRLMRPLFPGYVFVRMSLQRRLQVLEVPGIASLVGFGSQPVCMPEEDIQFLRRCMNYEGNIEPHPYTAVGSRVRVKGGPLAGLKGVVVQLKNRTRLVVSFDLIRRSATVEADQIDVEPLD
jgi:transcription antitermination factor NusG